MPYLQSATNNVFGLAPAAGPQGRTGLYAVSSTEATAILPGDAIVWTSIATVRAAVSADTRGFVGVAAAALPVASFSTVTLNCLVYDDPDQVYAVAVTTSAGLTITDYGKAFNIIATATGTGIPSTAVSRSKHALHVNSATSGAMLLMVGLHPVEALASGGYVITTSVGKPQKYLVKANSMALYGPLTT
jgi:hypothetical protein